MYDVFCLENYCGLLQPADFRGFYSLLDEFTARIFRLDDQINRWTEGSDGRVSVTAISLFLLAFSTETVADCSGILIFCWFDYPFNVSMLVISLILLSLQAEGALTQSIRSVESRRVDGAPVHGCCCLALLRRALLERFDLSRRTLSGVMSPPKTSPTFCIHRTFFDANFDVKKAYFASTYVILLKDIFILRLRLTRTEVSLI